MATQNEKHDAVATGAAAFAALETSLDGAEVLVNNTLEAVKVVYSLGVGRQGEFLTISNRMKAVNGRLASVLADVIELHSQCTEIAKRENCDVAIPQAYAITGGVTPLSGGR